MNIVENNLYFEYIGWDLQTREYVNMMIENPYVELSELAWVKSDGGYRLQSIGGMIVSSACAESKVIESLTALGYLDLTGMATARLHELQAALSEMLDGNIIG